MDGQVGLDGRRGGDCGWELGRGAGGSGRQGEEGKGLDGGEGDEELPRVGRGGRKGRREDEERRGGVQCEDMLLVCLRGGRDGGDADPGAEKVGLAFCARCVFMGNVDHLSRLCCNGARRKAKEQGSLLCADTARNRVLDRHGRRRHVAQSRRRHASAQAQALVISHGCCRRANADGCGMWLGHGYGRRWSYNPDPPTNGHEMC